jgi:hypothetical protein
VPTHDRRLLDTIVAQSTGLQRVFAVKVLPAHATRASSIGEERDLALDVVKRLDALAP